MELELVIFGQVVVFVTISLATLLAATAPRNNHPAPRSAPGVGVSEVSKRHIEPASLGFAPDVPHHRQGMDQGDWRISI